MKKIIKSRLFYFILGGIIFTSITVLASLLGSARDISFIPNDSGWNVDNVEDAINELKNKSDIYGVRRELSSNSSAWERVESSVGLIANAQIGTTSVRNDFDNIYPWSDIITVDLNHDGTENSRYNGTEEWFTNVTGEIMTKIPEFYYKREQVEGYEYVLISKNERSGYKKSEEFYIGRYTISPGTHSKSGEKPQDNTIITNFRNQATSLGSGWQIMDYHYFILQLLYLAEYANYNSQSMLGLGFTSTESTEPTASGGCNKLGMKSGVLVNDGKHSVVYRGIEDIFGNIWQFVDGINISNRKAYISYTPSKYAVDKFNDSYSEVGYTNSTSLGYISKLGYSTTHPLISLPIEVSGSATTHITDYYFQNTGNRIVLIGGRYGHGTDAGMWYWDCNNSSSFANSNVTARLLKI